MPNKILVEAINKYDFLYPEKKLVDRDTLRTIKYLKQAGHEVVVLPDNGKPFEYFFQKGIMDLFTNPIYVYFMGMASTIVGGLLTNAIQKVIENSKDKHSVADKNIIYNFNSYYYNIKGEKIPSGTVKDKKKKQKALQDEFQKLIDVKSPYPDLPVPILIDHKPKVIGWCALDDDGVNLNIIDSKILDKNVFRKINQGKIKGASVTGIATKTVCTICKSSYVDCVHVSGDFYNGIKCLNEMHEAIPLEMSLVKTPVHPGALIQLKKKT